MRLQLVGLADGRPIGFRRAFLRGLIIFLLTDTVALLIVMAVLMMKQPRRQGWHDLAVESVVIDERPLAPPLPGEPSTVRELLIKLLSGRRSPEPHQEPAALTTGPAQSPEPVEEHAPAPQRVTVGETAKIPATAPPDSAGPLPPNQGWLAVLDNGREIRINGLTLFGRNPQPRAGEEDSQLIKVADPDRTVSKTHLALTVDSRGLMVIDRGSTNGSAVTDPSGAYQLLTAEQPARLSTEGYIVSFGKHQLRISRTQGS